MSEIKSRWSGDVIFTNECGTVRLTLEAAVKKGANLKGAYLKGAYLTPIRDDFWAVLSAAPGEVMGLRAALVEDRVDGSTYSGDCACLVGTIANVCGQQYDGLPNLAPDSNRPAERFFLGIKKGDTPETNQVSKIVLDWLDVWVAGVRAAFGPKDAAA